MYTIIIHVHVYKNIPTGAYNRPAPLLYCGRAGRIHACVEVEPEVKANK